MAGLDNTIDKSNYLIGLDYLLGITDLEEKLIKEDPMLSRSGTHGEGLSIGKMSRGKKRGSANSRLSLGSPKASAFVNFDSKPKRDSCFSNYKTSVNVTSLRDALKSPSPNLKPKLVKLSSENFKKQTWSKSAFSQKTGWVNTKNSQLDS
jgi:hypothetical protein